LEAYQATGAAVLRTYWAVLLAEALARAGAAEEGLRVLDDAIGLIPGTGERRSEAELYRLRGELLQHLQSNTRHAALTPEDCFHRAVDIARRQQAKALELRAVMSLSRLWCQQGKRQAARYLLHDTVAWFSEGFGTADLQAAQTLLDELT
jgi:predicted ATPase